MSMKKTKSKEKSLKSIFRKFRDPAFAIGFIITWSLLESPAIFGGIMYAITGDAYWWGIAGGWVALTAPTLPIPVLPISIASAFAIQKIVEKRRVKRAKKKGYLRDITQEPCKSCRYKYFGCPKCDERYK